MQSLHSDPAYWARRLNTPKSPLFVRSLAEAIKFFRGNLPGLSDHSLESHLRPIDWHWPDFRIVQLMAGERIYAFRYDAIGPVGMYFSRSGTAARDAGIKTKGRSRVTYVVTAATDALWCRTRSIVTFWDPKNPSYLAVGGAMQLIVVNARLKVRLEISTSTRTATS